MMSDADTAPLSDERRELLELLLKKQGSDPERLPLRRHLGVENVPLSAAQRRVWSRGLLAPELPWGNIPVAFRVEGPFSSPALEASLDEIRRRHDILRATFSLRDGEPTQVVSPHARVPISVVDLRALPKDEREAKALEMASAQGRRLFDLLRDPVLQATVFQIEDEVHILVILTHHLAADGLSIRLLLREISLLYCAAQEGTSARLPDLPVQYADFTLWQRDWLRGETARKQMSFWKEQLRGAPTRLRLPVEVMRPGSLSFRGTTQTFRFSRSLSGAIHAISRQQGVTAFVTLLAGFEALLSRRSGQDEVVVATAVSNRNQAATGQLIGNFSNHLLLRLGFGDDPSFRTALGRARDVVLGAFANQDVPLESLRDARGREGEASPVPLLEALFILRDGPVSKYLDIPGAKVAHVPIDLEEAWLDLTLDVIDGEEISGVMEYPSERFRDSTVRDLLVGLEAMLDFAVRRPDEPLSAAPLPEVTGATVSSEPREEASFVPPRTETERALAGIWCELLGLRQVGVHENFFDVGGHSLVATRVLARLRNVFLVVLPLRALFEHPTLEGLAAAIDQTREARGGNRVSPIAAVSRKALLGGAPEAEETDGRNR